jgi:D-alanyl-D-alanine carboxypeptidase (penicillin-binding protein 5/6)
MQVIRFTVMNKKNFLLFFLIICVCLFLPVPILAAPSLSSSYYCLVDRETGQPIIGKNANTKRPVASTTKMMTAILAVEYADLDEMAVVSKYADRTPEYTIGLNAGQQLTVGELLKVALVRSSNDAAVVLAEHIAGDEAFFGYLMTKKAYAIGAMQTRFKNASGLPDPDHYSTAYDLALIGRNTLSKPYIAKMVATAETDFKHPGYREALTIRNTNGLLRSYPGADGIKTGTANESGKCLVGSATRGNRGLIAVVLKSGDREGDCKKLLDFGFNNTSQQKVLDHEMSFKNIKINGAEKTWADIVPAEDLWIWLGNNKTNIEKIVRLNYNLQAPIKKGQVLGEIDVYIDGGYFKSIDLVSQEDINRQTGYLKRMINGIMKHNET